MRHLLNNLSISLGMALASSCFAVLSLLHAQSAPGWAIPGLLVAALIVLIVAFCVAELAAMFPGSMGIRTYVAMAFNESVSVTVMLMYLLMIFCIAGVEGAVLADIVESIYEGVPAVWVLVLVFGLVALVNLRGLEFSQLAQSVLVYFLLIALFVLAVYALLEPEPVMVDSFSGHTDVSSVAEQIILAFMLFVGFEWVSNTANTSRQSARTLPQVLILSVVILSVLYLLMMLSLAALGSDTQGELAPAHILLSMHFFPGNGNILVLTFTLLAVVTSFNAGLIGVSRMIYVLSREGIFPPLFARLSPVRAVPYVTVISVCCLGLLIALLTHYLGRYEYLAQVAALVICAVYFMLILSLLRLRKRGRRSNGFISPLPLFSKYLASLFLFLAFWAILFSANNIWVAAILLSAMILATGLSRNAVKLKKTSKTLGV